MTTTACPEPVRQPAGVPVGGQYATYIGLPGYSDAGNAEQDLDQRLLKVVDALIDKVRHQH